MITYIYDEVMEIIVGGVSKATYSTINITSIGEAVQSGSHNNNVGQSVVVLDSGNFSINAQAFNKSTTQSRRLVRLN